ncbi:MAG TPA: COX15/CtaA family protein [Kineosporiaceae bacterium]|nr:COX15/CtaA family protein [Kineosporiaceae bacterium]
MAQTLISRALTNLPVGISRVWLRRILLANLVAQVGIVLTGGVVRLTGSGLGCPTFPECVPGSYIPVVNQPEGIHKFIEFGNRMLTTVVSVLAVAALLAVLRQVRAGQGGRRRLALGAVPFLGVMAQALIGGITVLTQLNPTVVAVHFLVSMGLIAGSTLLLLVAVPPASSDPVPSAPAPRLARRLAAAAGVTAALVLILGTMVTGSGPHSGDAADPNRFSFDIPEVTRTHSGLVWLFCALVLAIAVTLSRATGQDAARRWTFALLGVTAAQGTIGYLQYALGVPAWLVGVHMLGASLFVITTTGTVHAVFRRRPLESRLDPLPAFGQLGSLPGKDQPDQSLPIQR